MRKLIPIILLISFWASLSPAQVAEHGYEVGPIRFEGNQEIKYDQLLNVIRTRETPWAVQKWIYNQFDKEILFGRKPEYFDPITFASDYQQLKIFYEYNGFFHVRVDTSIIVHPDEDKVYLTFSIVEGRRSLIDTVLYNGLENLSPDVQEELSSNRQIILGMPYIQTLVEAEYTRIVHLCANNGYINVKLVTLKVQRYASTDNISLVFVFNLGQRFTFGNISIEQDTTSHQYIDSSIVLEHLDFSKGEFYSEEKKIGSERNLNRLGVFETTKIENAIPTNSTEITQIPIRVLVRTRSFQELTPEVGANDENNAFNILFGIGYNHRNFFGGARNFSTNLRLSIQSLQFGTIFERNALRDSSLISKIELTIQLIQPYFINNKTSISAALSAMLDKQSTYYIPSLSFRLGTQSQTTTYTRLFIDWNLQLSNPQTVATRHDTIIGTEWTKQFNSFIMVTLQRDKRNDIIYPSSGIYQSISIEEGGLFPRAFDGPLGLNLPYSQYVKLTLDGQWYWDPSNKRDLIWAARFRTGGALLYGISPLKDIPLTQRYYSGGSGSVRGWRARDLGAVPPDLRNLGGDAMFEGTIEARINPFKRGSLGFLDLEKLSFVLFYDCGNIWTVPQRMRLSEVAMAFGFGIRYNTIAGPIRIDFGMKLYDPDAPATRQWVTQKRFFPETVSQGIIHLGVGHTF
ncbi:MAG: BamA/TamA family outer membrane protein [Bacteroidota bacterium]|jgi:outer membrane protein assembly complex protein YaeT